MRKQQNEEKPALYFCMYAFRMPIKFVCDFKTCFAPMQSCLLRIRDKIFAISRVQQFIVRELRTKKRKTFLVRCFVLQQQPFFEHNNYGKSNFVTEKRDSTNTEEHRIIVSKLILPRDERRAPWRMQIQIQIAL